MDFPRKYRNRIICRIELVSALDSNAFLISPVDGLNEETLGAQYNGVYFTLSSVGFEQKSKETSSGTVYTLTLEFSFPNFPGADVFQQRFKLLSEIRITLNTGAVVRINKNDIALNSPIKAEFKSNFKTVGFSAQISQIFPFILDEQ